MLRIVPRLVARFGAGMLGAIRCPPPFAVHDLWHHLHEMRRDSRDEFENSHADSVAALAILTAERPMWPEEEETNTREPVEQP